MRISVLSHEWKTFIICVIWHQIYMFVIYYAYLTFIFWKMPILCLSRPVRSTVTHVHYRKLRCAIAWYYCMLTLHAFNGLSILYHITLIFSPIVRRANKKFSASLIFHEYLMPLNKFTFYSLDKLTDIHTELKIHRYIIGIWQYISEKLFGNR